MARKFLYIIAGLVVLVLAVSIALRFWAEDLTGIAFVPNSEFKPQPPISANGYADPAMWISRPGFGAKDPARWLPAGAETGEADAPGSSAAVFFIHPTSYFERAQWNAPLDDETSRELAANFTKGMASPFNRSDDLWAPRYRQAAIGAFMTGKPEAEKAIETAYDDVLNAFDYFIETVDKDRPIILAGHSQGAFHLRRLMRDRVKGTDLQDRIAAAYAIGWPISLVHDLPYMGLPPCTSADQAGCVLSWLSFAEPADQQMVLGGYAFRGWLDGEKGDGRPFLCINPLTGRSGGQAPASANLGTVRSDEETGKGTLVSGQIPARCGEDGFLYIGEPPELGRWVLPGNNYHVYDIALFWANIRADAARRVEAWKAQR